MFDSLNFSWLKCRFLLVISLPLWSLNPRIGETALPLPLEPTQTRVRCGTAEELYAQLEKKGRLEIELTGADYIFHKPLQISSPIKLSSGQRGFINLHTVPGLDMLFEITPGGSLVFQDLKLDGGDVKARHLVYARSSGQVQRYSLVIDHCQFRYFSRNYGCENFFSGLGASAADSIILKNSSFENNAINGFTLEADSSFISNKAEKLRMINCNFINQTGILLSITRQRIKESGPGFSLLLQDNYFTNCHTEADQSLLFLSGLRESTLLHNSFVDCNPGRTLLKYSDPLKARHRQLKNLFLNSGSQVTSPFVETENNSAH